MANSNTAPKWTQLVFIGDFNERHLIDWLKILVTPESIGELNEVIEQYNEVLEMLEDEPNNLSLRLAFERMSTCNEWFFALSGQAQLELDVAINEITQSFEFDNEG